MLQGQGQPKEGVHALPAGAKHPISPHMVDVLFKTRGLNRRHLLTGAGALLSSAVLPAPRNRALAETRLPGMRTIPSSGERIPAVGMGTWITFNVGDDPVLRAARAEVMRAFFEAGGRMIDSSPMYGSSQSVIGHGLESLGRPEHFFAADKVWTSSPGEGPGQIERSRRQWGVPRFQLLQVHNLLAWEAHLETLEAMKVEGRLRYLGITTSHGRRHSDLERIMRERPLDFVQLTYNPVDRQVEERLLPLAREKGIAVIVNRPFRRGSLTARMESQPLPKWAGEIGAESWAQIILKFILSHDAVTLPIPATTKPEHARENLRASGGLLPDAALRRRIAETIGSL